MAQGAQHGGRSELPGTASGVAQGFGETVPELTDPYVRRKKKTFPSIWRKLNSESVVLICVLLICCEAGGKFALRLSAYV